MDENQYISGGVGASIVIAIIVLKQVYNAINHKRIRSTCCGRKLEASMDVEDTTPTATTISRLQPCDQTEVVISKPVSPPSIHPC